jgi:hypothetical protein
VVSIKKTKARALIFLLILRGFLDNLTLLDLVFRFLYEVKIFFWFFFLNGEIFDQRTAITHQLLTKKLLIDFMRLYNKLISLFSGAGGLDLGFQQAGFEII